MKLEHEDLCIRNATPDDAETLARWWNDGAVMAHAGFPKGLGQTAHDIACSLAHDSDQTHRRLIFEIGGVASGEMNYRNKGDGVAEIGIKICEPAQQNRGNGRKLLSMLLRALFDELGYRKVVLDTNLQNVRAQHVYESLGFRKVRICRDSWTDQLGALQSSVEYELLPGQLISFLHEGEPRNN